jgi:hypothetical protein
MRWESNSVRARIEGLRCRLILECFSDFFVWKQLLSCLYGSPEKITVSSVNRLRVNAEELSGTLLLDLPFGG